MEVVDTIEQALKNLLKQQVPPLQVRNERKGQFEVAGTKPAMQGKQRVDGFYFASVVPKPKDVRLYFFPIYTHPDTFELSSRLKKCLKGKSCFHIRTLDEDLRTEIEEMISKGVKTYMEEGLI